MLGIISIMFYVHCLPSLTGGTFFACASKLASKALARDNPGNCIFPKKYECIPDNNRAMDEHGSLRGPARVRYDG